MVAYGSGNKLELSNWKLISTHTHIRKNALIAPSLIVAGSAKDWRRNENLLQQCCSIEVGLIYPFAWAEEKGIKVVFFLS